MHHSLNMWDQQIFAAIMILQKCKLSIIMIVSKTFSNAYTWNNFKRVKRFCILFWESLHMIGFVVISNDRKNFFSNDIWLRDLWRIWVLSTKPNNPILYQLKFQPILVFISYGNIFSYYSRFIRRKSYWLTLNCLCGAKYRNANIN